MAEETLAMVDTYPPGWLTFGDLFDRAFEAAPFAEYERKMEEPSALDCGALAEICKSFVLRDVGAISRFLREHRTLPQLVLEALPHLRTHFGPDTVFSLKVLADEDGSRELFATAMWPGDSREAINALDKFHDCWWIDRSQAAGGRLNFTYELE